MQGKLKINKYSNPTTTTADTTKSSSKTTTKDTSTTIDTGATEESGSTVDLSAGRQRLTVSSVSTYTQNIDCYDQDSWQTVATYTLEVAEAPLTLERLYITMQEYPTSSSVRMANDYNFILKDQNGTVVAEIEDTGPTYPNVTMTLAFPRDIVIDQGETYTLLAQGKYFQPLGYGDDAITSLLKNISSHNTTVVGVFSDGTSYEAEASVANGNVVTTDGTVTMYCSG